MILNFLTNTDPKFMLEGSFPELGMQALSHLQTDWATDQRIRLHDQ